MRCVINRVAVRNVLTTKATIGAKKIIKTQHPGRASCVAIHFPAAGREIGDVASVRAGKEGDR